MRRRLILAGHGGQGVLELANYISLFEMLRGQHVACTPSYGPESRGGKVKCYVVVSEQEIDSPIVEEADCLIAMNIPSMDYLPLLTEGGTLFMNSSLILAAPERSGIRVVRVPATEIAADLKSLNLEGVGDSKIAANSVMFGAYLAVTGEPLSLDLMNRVFTEFLTGRKEVYVPLNMKAVQRGYDYGANLAKGQEAASSKAL